MWACWTNEQNTSPRPWSKQNSQDVVYTDEELAEEEVSQKLQVVAMPHEI